MDETKQLEEIKKIRINYLRSVVEDKDGRYTIHSINDAKTELKKLGVKDKDIPKTKN